MSYKEEGRSADDTNNNLREEVRDIDEKIGNLATVEEITEVLERRQRQVTCTQRYTKEEIIR